MDWGIGGLGCLQEWKRRRPDHGVIYFSDSGYTSYGTVSAPALVARLRDVFSWLRSDFEVGHVIVACNAASTALARLHSSHRVAERLPRAMSIIESAVELVHSEIPRGRPLAIMGEKRTVRSRIYPRLIRDRPITQRIGHSLSALVEAGELEGRNVESALGAALRPLARGGHLLLACTHYAALKPAMLRLRPDLTIWDPVPTLVTHAERRCAPDEPSESADVFLTSGSPGAMAASARKAFQVDLAAERVRVKGHT